MKKLIIALVCVGLLAALTIPSIYSASPWLTYTLEFSEDVDGEVVECSARRRFISSSSIDIDRPTLTLSNTFDTLSKVYSGSHDGQYLDLSEHKDVITMQFFFFDPDTGKKVQLIVEGGTLIPDDGWLLPSFTVIFEDDYAEINPTKGKRIPHWTGNVNITIVCEGE